LKQLAGQGQELSRELHMSLYQLILDPRIAGNVIGM
jgi:hypothetical protein